MGDAREIKLPLNQRAQVCCRAVWGDKGVLGGQLAGTNHPPCRSIRQLHWADKVGATAVQELTAGAVLMETLASGKKTPQQQEFLCCCSTSRFKLVLSANHTPRKINKQAPHIYQGSCEQWRMRGWGGGDWKVGGWGGHPGSKS